MGRFLALVFFFVVAAGAALHRGVELPSFGSWIGQLPGDIMIHKGKMTIFVPFTSSILISTAISIILSVFTGRKN